jgi:hypothetical protein
MFRAGLLLIIRTINSVQTAVGVVMRYVDWLLDNCCLYGDDPPKDEQQDCVKHVEAYY